MVIHLPDGIEKKLKALADSRGRRVEAVVEEAVERYLQDSTPVMGDEGAIHGPEARGIAAASHQALSKRLHENRP